MQKSEILKWIYVRYENGCLTPDMGSVFIALDPAVKENGCLQVSLFFVVVFFAKGEGTPLRV